MGREKGNKKSTAVGFLIRGLQDDGILPRKLEKLKRAEKSASGPSETSTLSGLADCINNILKEAEDNVAEGRKEPFPTVAVQRGRVVMNKPATWGDVGLHYEILKRYSEGDEERCIARELRFKCGPSYIDTVVGYYIGMLAALFDKRRGYSGTSHWNLGERYRKGSSLRHDLRERTLNEEDVRYVKEQRFKELKGKGDIGEVLKGCWTRFFGLGNSLIEAIGREIEGAVSGLERDAGSIASEFYEQWKKAVGADRRGHVSRDSPFTDKDIKAANWALNRLDRWVAVQYRFLHGGEPVAIEKITLPLNESGGLDIARTDYPPVRPRQPSEMPEEWKKKRERRRRGQKSVETRALRALARGLYRDGVISEEDYRWSRISRAEDSARYVKYFIELALANAGKRIKDVLPRVRIDISKVGIGIGPGGTSALHRYVLEKYAEGKSTEEIGKLLADEFYKVDGIEKLPFKTSYIETVVKWGIARLSGLKLSFGGLYLKPDFRRYAKAKLKGDIESRGDRDWSETDRKIWKRFWSEG